MEVSDLRLGDLAEAMLMASEMHAESPVYRDLPLDIVQVGAWIAMHIQRENLGAWGVWTPMGELAGCMFGSVTTTFFGPTLLAQEDGIYIRPKHRGSPAAALLLERYLAWAKEQGVARAEATVSAGIDDERATKFFERFGFRRQSHQMGISFDSP
jgi:GNAT superfamily N-acetyltransferase